MLARLPSAALRGLNAEPVDVEVDLSRGLPAWNMVGLPEAAVREARDRVRSALLNSGFEFPLRHISPIFWHLRTNARMALILIFPWLSDYWWPAVRFK